MSSQPKQHLVCSLCRDVFKDPVALSCNHNFCKNCLQRFWLDKDIKTCPVCNKKPVTTDPPCNAALRSVCENFMCKRDQKASAEPEPLCALHSEKLRLFCQDHQQPVCVICRDSKAHSNHRFIPTNEAARDHRQEREGFLKLLQEKLKFFEEVKENYEQTAEHIQVQARHTETQVRGRFKELHQFLQEEEEARVAALKQEAKQKTQTMNGKIKSLDREIETLSETIQATIKDLKAADVQFLQTYSSAVETIQLGLLLDDPNLIPGALINQTKHLGNLSYSILNRMKEKVFYSPVILDPNTAHPKLTLSDDLTSVRCEKTQKRPENLERMVSYPSVLGSEGFDSQTHSWEVEVGDSAVWAVGVSAEADKPSKFLKISLCDGEYKAESSQHPPVALRIKTKLKKIKVHLDCVEKRLSFSDADTNTNVHTFTHTFTERLFPYFNVVNAQPLKIVPLMVSVAPGLDGR